MQTFHAETPHRLEALVQDDDFALATLDHYLLLVWRKRVTAAGARAAEEAMTRLYAARPTAPLGFITLIEEGCSLSVPSEPREIIARMLKDHNYALGAAAVVYEGAGFFSAVVRSVITAINIASRAVFRSDVSSSAQTAVAFATQTLRDAPRQRALLDALDSLRGRSVGFVPASKGALRSPALGRI